MIDKYDMKRVSMLVCFAGQNRRIEIKPNKCSLNRATKMFTYTTKYSAENGKTYLLEVKSIADTEGSRANVTITDLKTKTEVAKRHGVEVRFYKYLFL
jgi:hypothetical protein